MKYFLLLSLVLLGVTGFSQSKLTRFEKEPLEFRNSLYPILDTMDYNRISSFDLPDSHSLKALVDAFYNVNKEAFLKYKLKTSLRNLR